MMQNSLKEMKLCADIEISPRYITNDKNNLHIEYSHFYFLKIKFYIAKEKIIITFMYMKFQIIQY